MVTQPPLELVDRMAARHNDNHITRSCADAGQGNMGLSPYPLMSVSLRHVRPIFSFHGNNFFSVCHVYTNQLVVLEFMFGHPGKN